MHLSDAKSAPGCSVERLPFGASPPMVRSSPYSSRTTSWNPDVPVGDSEPVDGWLLVEVLALIVTLRNASS